MNELTHLQIEQDADGIMIVRFDDPERSTNTLGSTTFNDLEAVLDQLEGRDGAINGVIFASGKPGNFIAGVDLFEISKLDRGDLEPFLERGQKAFERIARLPITTVAAINGTCLGGGCELALACDWRVASDHGRISIGLPEISLGILPAWGGTTRLTLQHGLMRSLPGLLTGRVMPPRRAMKAGLIDEVVRPEALLTAARRLLRKSPPRRQPSRLDRIVMTLPPLRRLVCRSAERQAHEKTFGNYPAAGELIRAAETACRVGHQAGLDAERAAVTRLVDTEACRNLMRLFFLRQDAKRSSWATLDTKPADVETAAVIGGGVMGAGIVHALARAGLAVRLFDVNEAALSAALNRVRKQLDQDVRSKKMSPLESRQAMHRICPATINGLESTASGLRHVDLVIEAVSENIELKRRIFGLLDAGPGAATPGAVLASNTSSFRIGDLATAATHRGRVVGMHFFNPVAKMPLVEIVRGPESDDASLATALQLAQKLGKTAITVGDGPGFLVNRVLIPYLAEALVMATEGPVERIATIDRTMKQWGMPMGPFELIDQIGLDVSMYVLRSLKEAVGSHIHVPEGVSVLADAIEQGATGRKGGRGFYVYPTRKRRKPRPNEQLINALIRTADHQSSATVDDDTVDRLMMPMINEAARSLVEGIVDHSDTIDLATVLGLGLAPFRGGLAHYADTIGLDQVVARMTELSRRHDDPVGRFQPIGALRRAADAHLPMQSLVTGGDAATTADQTSRSKTITANH